MLGAVPQLALVPKSGMIVPELGTKRPKPRAGLADALFTKGQQRVLGLLFGQPDRRFQSAELIRLARGGVGAVHRQLARLVASGLVEMTQIGNQKHYQARRDSAVFPELRGLIVKTVGVVAPLRDALQTFAKLIHAAFVFGSVASGADKASSDIDLMVVSDSLTYPQVFEALQAAESRLGRHVNPTVMTRAQWRTKQARKDSFVARRLREPRIYLLGSDHALK